MTLTDEDVGRMREFHKPWPTTSICTCRQPWPCDAYRLLEERRRSQEALKALQEATGSNNTENPWLGVCAAVALLKLDFQEKGAQFEGFIGQIKAAEARISELEPAPKAEAIPFGAGFEERRVQEIATIRRSERLPDMSQRIGAPKAEAPMTREVEDVLDRSGLVCRAPRPSHEHDDSGCWICSMRARLSDEILSIAAAARKEAEEPHRETLAALVASEIRREKAEHSRQALAEALRAGHRKLGTYAGVFKDDKELTRLLGEWDAALATHGQDHP